MKEEVTHVDVEDIRNANKILVTILEGGHSQDLGIDGK
jgi:hypothetical protein